jgi:BirA family transcriptional regulator, biotin operon repressor / biotin---[acetyl-CoA-carboxylase] ligase
MLPPIPNLIRLHHTTSTNDEALLLLSKTRPIEGTAFLAAYQSHGRGQFGSNWASESDKNVLCSIIVYPEFLDPTQSFNLLMQISLAVAHTVSLYLPDNDVYIKWPNDIYFKNKKIGGILMQTAIRGKWLEYAVCGIGLNILQVSFPSNCFQAASFCHFMENAPDPRTVFQQLYVQFMRNYETLKQNSTDNSWLQNMKTQYENKLLFKNQLRNYTLENNQIIHGKIIGVDASGKLIIEDEKGMQLTFMPKTIRFFDAQIKIEANIPPNPLNVASKKPIRFKIQSCRNQIVAA